ncbi:hypothetical protein, partial [Haemophilus parainfluenzae]|uniref:hypothetical protein n=1 Tax=Haemophilus parainfluenzae TaxID=729 RepID=UPI001CEDEDF1
ALDGGDAGQPAVERDALEQLEAPFSGPPQRLWTTELRFYDMLWGNDSLALGVEYWYASRQLRTWRLNPANPEIAPIQLHQRDVQDS